MSDAGGRGASASASARARRASGCAPATRSTSTLDARRRRHEDDEGDDVLRSAMVNVWSGSHEEPVGEQRGRDARRRRRRARRRAAAITTTATRKSSRSVASVERARGRQRATARERGQTDQRPGPRPRRAAREDGAATTGRAPRPAAGSASLVVARRCEITWTSMPAGAADDRLMTEPCSSSCQRLRRLAPSTIWVAFSDAGEVDERRGDVVADDLAVACRRARSSSCRCAVEVEPGAWPCRPSSATTCTPTSSPLARPAMRAARRMSCSPPGAPVTATTTRSRVSHGVGDAVARRGSSCERVVDPVGDPQQRQLAQRAEVAGPEVVGRARRRPCRAGRCCRGPSAGAAPRGVMSTSSIWSARAHDRVGHGLALLDAR